ncbi:unnamed protein product [Dovyalis caffra]|uniref:Uncharacterized protein n=1 Tax=Dovyalis caffra TaxID=77055 RepID=A0AAV1RLI8_9ROSI|nr:unnamed protein product [Dovyalis caffra]
MGSDQIEGVSLYGSELSRDLHLESDAFAKMDHLRFLKFYGGFAFTELHLPSSSLSMEVTELKAYLCTRSELSRDLHLKSESFAKMDHLRFLEFYGGFAFTGLHLPSSGIYDDDQIEGVSLFESKLSRDLHLKSNAFAKMDHFRFFEFYGGFDFTRLRLPSSGLSMSRGIYIG